MPKFKDLTGKIFSNLTVVKYAGYKDKYSRSMWICKCSCGIEGAYAGVELSNNSRTSCGCKKVERARTLANKYLLTHGKTSGSNSKIYRIWANMITRCSNPKASNYKYYGGRGISVSEEWKTFSNFLADMGDCPDGLTLDRINVDGNYEKENCRWADWGTQNNNRRKSVIHEVP